MSACFPNVDNGLVRLVISRSIQNVFASFCDPPKENRQRHHGTNMTDSKDAWSIHPRLFFVVSLDGCAESKQRNEPIVSSGTETNTNNDRIILLQLQELRVPCWGYGHHFESSFFMKYFRNCRCDVSLSAFRLRDFGHQFLIAPVGF